MVNPVMAIFKPDFNRGIKLLKTVIVSGLNGKRLQVNQKMSWDHVFRLWKHATKSASPVICIGFSLNYKQKRNISQLWLLAVKSCYGPLFYPYLIKRAMAQAH